MIPLFVPFYNRTGQKVKLILTYPASTRNFDEILRVIDKQLTANYIATLQTGKTVRISPSIKDEDIPANSQKAFKE
jgi:alkyl hydroperoxide reductase subunit AhpC